MPDSPALLPTGLPDTSLLLPALLDLLPSGVVYYTPQFDAAGMVVDLAFAYLNPAAQRLLQLPAQPAATYLQQFPDGLADGSFTWHRDTFLAGEAPAHFALSYQANGADFYVDAKARRVAPGLLVSYTSHQPPASLATTRHQAQAREQQARTEAERQRLYEVLMQLPAQVAVYNGPDHVFAFANPRFQSFVGVEELVGRSLREASQGAVGPEVVALLDRVYTTGEPMRVPELAVHLPHLQPDHQVPLFVNASYLPLRNDKGHIYGVLDFSYDVTEQVLARQQVEQLNQALENRVTERTQQLTTALQGTEHQREQARVQQRLLSQILGQVPAAIATLSGPEHRYTFFNDSYQALAANRTALGNTVAEVFPEVKEQGFINLLDKVYATGEPFVGTETLIMLHNKTTGQAEQRYVDFLYQPLFDGQQRTQGILAFILDVTERVRTRKQAETLQAAMLAVMRRQGQERQNVYQLFTQAPAAICLLREPNHRIDYFNPAYQALFPGRELRGHILADVQPEAPQLVRLLDGIYQSGQAQFQDQVAVRIPQADGQPPLTRYFDFSYQAYREGGLIAGVFIFGFDVTERVLARQQVEAQQAELQHIFEQAPVATAILRGPNLVIELANPAVERIWGRSAAQVLGRPYFEALPETAGQGFEEILANVLRTGQSFSVTEAPVQLPRAHTGQPMVGYVNFVFQPLFDDQQRTTGLLAIGIEVTEQVLARQQVQGLNDELQATNSRLRRTNTDLDTFVYTASHDLKAPIANIEGLLAALRNELPSSVLQGPLVERLLGLMDGSVMRFQQTIGHLTTISQLQQPETAETVDLVALVEAVRLDLAPLVEAASATLTVHLDTCGTVRAASKTIRSVVYNLLSNAIKYRAPSRPALVQLRGHCTASHVVLVVQDNGLGLNEKQQSQLFGMFRRLHTHVEGSGVGLFMVKRLVENAGGTIAVQSKEGVGTTFTVSLPI